MLNDYCRTNMTSLEKTWWGLAKHLVTKYAQIPSVLDGDKLVSPGYSNEWLRAVDFGAVQAEETAKGL